MLGGGLALAACAQFDSLKQTDWSAQFDQLNQPGPLGALIDRKPPPVLIRTSGPYPGPLSEPVPPLISPDVAEQVVAEPLRAALAADARMSMAQASMMAASAATGTPVSWKAADASGTVTPARDAYYSHRGHVCRDLQQLVQELNGLAAEQITLCRTDIGDNRVLWLPGSPD